MIEVATFPQDLTAWDGNDPAFYLEVFGEASPTIDSRYAEVIPAGSSSETATADTPIYEYWWTIGHPGQRPEHHRLFSRHSESPWSDLGDPAAHVFLYFPLSSGWRIMELLATTKYLSPSEEEKSLSERAVADWAKYAPALSDVGSIAKMLEPIPGVGVAAAGSARVLSAMSKLQLGNVPSSADGFNWFVEKVTTADPHGRGAMQGIMWTLPKSMFESLGGRITGSLAVSFIPSKPQGPDEWAPLPGTLCAQACVCSGQGNVWAPPAGGFVELQLTPKVTGPTPPSG